MSTSGVKLDPTLVQASLEQHVETVLGEHIDATVVRRDVGGKVPEGDLPDRLDTSSLDKTYGAVLRADAFGVVGDWTGGVTGTGTNDTAAIQALVNAAPEGATIQFTRGKTYRVDSVTITKALTLDFDTADLIVRPWDGVATTATAAFKFTGTAGPSKGVANVSQGSTTVTLNTASDAAGFAPGDWIELFDDNVRTNWNGATNTGRWQLSRVLVADSGAGVLTLAMPAEWDFLTNPRIKKLAMLERPAVLNVGNVTEIDPGLPWPGDVSSGPNIFHFDLCVSPRIERVQVNGVNCQSFVFSFCFNPISEHCHALNAYRPDVGGHGYHTRFLVSHKGEVRNAFAQSMRHTVDHVSSYDCGSRNCITIDNRGSAYIMHGLDALRAFSDFDTVHQKLDLDGTGGWSAGNGSFGADHGFHINRPTFVGVGKAFGLACQATDMTVIDPDVTTTREAFQMICGASGLTVRGGKVRITAPAVAGFAGSNGVLNAFSTLAGTTIPLGDITFEGVTFEGATTSLVVDGGRVLRFVRNRHSAPSMDYSGSACYKLSATSTGVHPDVVDFDGNYLDGGTVRNHINTNGVTPTRFQRVTHNKAVANLAAGISVNITSTTKLAGNDMRVPAGTSGNISLTGDVSTAKSQGAMVFGNYPQTYDSATETLAVSASFDSAANSINTIAKVTGKQVMCVNHAGGSRPHWAAGVNPTDVWKNADGTNAHTPV